jgi:hypothetical protein
VHLLVKRILNVIEMHGTTIKINDNSDSGENHGQQEGYDFDCDPIRHLKQVVSHLNTINEHEEILTTFSVILICLKAS